MKQPPYRLSRDVAFTLIELLVVIAIIAILAAMVFPIMSRVNVSQAKAIARAQLNQLDTAIKTYQAKYGFYPPDNPNDILSPPLYYELMGCIVTYTNNPIDPTYFTLDGSSQITSNNTYVNFRASGFANASATTRGGDDGGRVATSFLKDLKAAQVSGSLTNPTVVRFLLCSVGPESPAASGNSRFRYNSSHPTNNPNSFDLWVDLYFGGKTNRISNWSTEPQLAR